VRSGVRIRPIVFPVGVILGSGELQISCTNVWSFREIIVLAGDPSRSLPFRSDEGMQPTLGLERGINRVAAGNSPWTHFNVVHDRNSA